MKASLRCFEKHKYTTEGQFLGPRGQAGWQKIENTSPSTSLKTRVSKRPPVYKILGSRP